MQRSICIETVAISQSLPKYPSRAYACLKNISERIIKLLSGKSDSAKVRAEERARNRFPSTWCDVNEKKHLLPPAPFRLNKEELSIANKRSLSVVVPHGVDWKCRELFALKSSQKLNE